MPTVNTGRKHVSELLKARTEIEKRINYHVASVDVRTVSGTSSVDNVGLVVKFDPALSAFVPFAVNADWAASTAYSVGDVVKPTTQNGLEYVAIAAGTSAASEPTFPTVVGATVSDGTVTWLARLPYGKHQDSPLPNQATLAVAVGAKEGLGFNKEDTALSTTPVKMTVLFRGAAGLVEDGIVGFSSLAAEDQAELSAALEREDIAIEDSAESISPSYVV